MAFGADRTVKVNLKATVSDYLGKMNAASRATKDFSQAAVKSAEQHRQSWDRIGKGLTVAGAAIGAAVGLAVKSYADFDRQMSNVRAVSGAGAADMERLRAAALEAGKDTKFSASEAAEATAELAKVGINTSDILGGALTGSLNLAAAGNLDLATAAQVSGQAMKIFGLHGKDVGHIADVLASGANKSAADVDDLAQALQQGGLVAKQTGLNLDDTVGVLSAFADNALMGSDAGTSLKTMLQRLNPQSQQAADLMDKLGLSAYNSQGQFIGITAYAGKLQTALGKMSDEQRNAALQTLFGSDAVRGANILYREGAQGIANYVKAVNDQGAAARVAAIQMDNLSGDLEQLKGSIETALINAGSGANDVLRTLTQSVTGAVNAFNDLPRPVQQAVAGIGAVGSAGALAVGGMLLLVPRIADTRRALKDLGVTATKVKGILGGPWGIALAAAAVGLGAFAASQAEAKKRADDLLATLDAQTGAITTNSRATAAKALEDEGILKLARGMGISLDTLTDAYLGNAAAQRDVNDALSAYGATLAGNPNIDTQVEGIGKVRDALNGGNKALADARDKWQRQNDAIGKTPAATDAASEGLSGVTGAVQDYTSAAEDAKKATDDYIKGLQDAGLVVLDKRKAIRDYRDALDAASKALKDNGKTLSLNTEAGRKNQEALDDLADSALKQAQAIYDAGGSEADYRASLLKSRGDLIKTGERFGLTRVQAQRYADSILHIPPKAHTQATFDAHKASTAIEALKRQLATIPTNKTVVVTTLGRYVVGNNSMAGGSTKNSAQGGYISGPGTPTSDSIPAYLSNGEYVVKAAAVAKYGKGFFDSVNGMRFASGGFVSRTQAAAAAQANVVNNTTFEVQGADAHGAVQQAMRQWEYREVNRINR